MSSIKTSILIPVLGAAAVAVLWLGVMLLPKTPAPPAHSESPEPQTNVTRSHDAAAPQKTPSGSEGNLWSTYHGGPALAGAVETSLSSAPEVLWRYQADAPVYYTPVTDGRHVVFNTIRGSVVALDFDGKEVWAKQLMAEPYRDGRPRKERFESPAACFNGTAVVGSIRGTVYAFDSGTGEEKWTFDTGSTILGTISAYMTDGGSNSGRVFVLEQDDAVLHSLNLATGEPVWQTEAIDRCDGSPSVHGTNVVFGSCAAALHVFSPIDGQFLRNIEFDGDSQVAGGVAIVGDSAYSGSHSGRVFRVNLTSGEIEWINEDSQGEVFATPAVNGESVVFSSDDGRVYALERESGALRWKFDTDGLPTSAVIAGDKVVVASDGRLYLLRLSTGETIWSYEVSDEISSPAIINGMIVVGGEDGSVTAFR